jgi:regulator of sigma E protease
MNVLFAWFLFVVILVIGVPTQVEEGMATKAAVLTITGVLPDSPAAGVIPPQVTIMAITAGAVSVSNPYPSTFSDMIAERGPAPVIITYRDKGAEPVTVTVTPVVGLIAASPDRAAIGVSLSLVETISKPLIPAIVEATGQTVVTTKNILVGLGSLAAGAITGTADYSQVAGPIGIVSYVGDAASIGFTSLLLFTAIISLNLAVINLLPIPALDGGRLVFVAIEAVTRKPIKAVWAARVNLAGFAFLMLLMLAATINDVSKFF